jgi:Helix-turn-helix.
MENTDINWTSMSNTAIVEAIGKYIKHERLTQNKTQAQVARNAGVNSWTLSQIENGQPITLLSLIEILRALRLLDIFNIFKIETQISPIALAKLERQKRQRARNKGKTEQTESDW